MKEEAVPVNLPWPVGSEVAKAFEGTTWKFIFEILSILTVPFRHYRWYIYYQIGV